MLRKVRNVTMLRAVLLSKKTNRRNPRTGKERPYGRNFVPRVILHFHRVDARGFVLGVPSTVKIRRKTGATVVVFMGVDLTRPNGRD